MSATPISSPPPGGGGPRRGEGGLSTTAPPEGTRDARLVWITRAEPAAHDTAAALRALGAETLVAPLIATRALETPPPFPPREAAALAFTSAAGVRAFVAAGHALGATPVYAVGRATAHAARTLGAMHVHDAAGDVGDLARLIAAARAAGELGGAVLHPGAARLAAPLSGAEPWPVYETVATSAHYAAARRALEAGRVRVVLLQSPSAARALADFVAASPAFAAVAIHALSPACVFPLAPADAARAAIAPHSREADLLPRAAALANRAAPATRERLPSEPP